MKVLVANLGSTSFKFRLFDMESEQQLARGGIERIGSERSSWSMEIGEAKLDGEVPMHDHAVAVRHTLSQLTDADTGCLQSATEVAAIGFKAVHGGRAGGVQLVTNEVLEAMEEMNSVAPAHNPPYIAAMRLLSDELPEIPLVAAFETGFHETIPKAQSCYGIPFEWSEQLGIRRYGFHGASHRYIAERTAELAGRADLRVISCHLGGSSSLCAIQSGKSIATTMGMSPQTGMVHNNRVGDFDPYAIPLIADHTGMSTNEILDRLATGGGLLGVSGISGDVRDLDQAAMELDSRAQLALDVFVADVRRHLGSMLVALGGVDWLVFTGGIGEHGHKLRSAICRDLHDLGIQLDAEANLAASSESRIDHAESRTEIWVVPTNEEWVVASQTWKLLKE